MEEEKSAALCLKPGAHVVQDQNGWGLQKGASVRYAATAVQALILRRIAAHVFDLHALTLAVMRQENRNGPLAALEIASFILDFSDFLED
jgi:hypothetical protein